jgi:CAAX protease family protein
MDFITQAYKGKTKWYHYLLGTLLTFFIMQFGAFPLWIANEFADKSKFNVSTLNPGIDNNLFLLIMIIPFILGLLGLYISVLKINRFPFLKVLTARTQFDWRRMLFAFILWFSISLILLVVDYYINPEHYVLSFKMMPFLILVVLSITLMPLQTSFEEVYFRGYLMQGFGVLTKYRLIALVITSTVFGLLHGANPEVSRLGNILLIYYVATGFLFGIITLMDDGLELTLGLHAANNVVAAIFVTTNWSVFQTDALFIDISEPEINWMMFVPIIVIYPLLLLGLSKKYGWENWRQKLLGKVIKPQIRTD